MFDIDKLTWSKLLLLSEPIINGETFGPGVYRLSYKAADGFNYVFYIGRSDESVKKRLLQHLSDTEENMCIKISVKNLECYFKFAPVSDKSEREEAEKALYQKYRPKCNTQEPGGQKT